MKWTLFHLLAWVNLISIYPAMAQSNEFYLDTAVIVYDLNQLELREHLDLMSPFRQPVLLTDDKNVFMPGQKVWLETFYQKSESNRLLKMNQVQLQYHDLYAMTEGSGKTIFRISDGQCVSITVCHTKEENESFTSETITDCLY